MKFIVKPARRGDHDRPQTTVVLVAANGEPIMVGETYDNRGDAETVAHRIVEEIQAGHIEIEHQYEADR